jgi:hypothetical protein
MDIATRQAELIEPTTMLWSVLAAHPALVTEADLEREIGSHPPTWLERDRIEIGLRKLLDADRRRPAGLARVPPTGGPVLAIQAIVGPREKVGDVPGR